MAQDDIERAAETTYQPPPAQPPVLHVGPAGGPLIPTSQPAGPPTPAPQPTNDQSRAYGAGYGTRPHPTPQAAPGHMLTDQRSADSALVVVAWVTTALTAAYMLPWAIAVSRGKSNAGSIGLINLLLGWSLVGWVVALVMACQAHQLLGVPMSVNVVVAQQFPQSGYGHPAPPVAMGPGPGWYPSPDGYGRQYWDGQSWTGHRAP